jgi:phosphoenolpyruvate-protein kinase (PTS system EI component)
LLANASSVAEARLAVQNGAEGIGLLRTEFLVAALPGTGSAPPGEDELTAAYGAILEVMGKRPVVVRALDAGGDKPLPFLDFGHEPNPFLGWRGIRILLDQPELFATQTRALLRAAARHGTELRLMFPMISTLDEFRRARMLVERVLAEEQARAEALVYSPLRLGVMIETPAAALLAAELAREADFLSLGTNDLVQYTLACDRGNARVADLCQFLHPAVLRLVDMVVRAAHAADCTVGVCGEAAGDPDTLPLLIGLGVDELSVGAARLPAVRCAIRAADYSRLQQVASEALTKATTDEVRELLASSTRQGG